MKRQGLKRLTAALLCLLLCVTSFAGALAEGVDAMGPVMALPMDGVLVTEDAEQEDGVTAVKAKVKVNENTVRVSLTADPNYSVVVTLVHLDANKKEVVDYTVTLKPGVTSTVFDKVPMGNYTLKANYTKKDVPGAKAFTVPVVVETELPPEETEMPMPGLVAVPTPVPTAEPASEPVQQPETLLPGFGDAVQSGAAIAPVPEISGGAVQFPMGDAIVPGEDVADAPDNSDVTGGDYAIQTPMLPQDGSVPGIQIPTDDTQGGYEIAPPMLPLDQAPLITTAPDVSATPNETPDTTPDTAPDEGELPEDGGVMLMAASPIAIGSTVTGTISNIKEGQTIVVNLTPAQGNSSQKTYEPVELKYDAQQENQTYTYTFTDVDPGEYTLTISIKDQPDFPSITLSVTVSETVTTASAISANAQGGKDSVTVNVTAASQNMAVVVTLYKDAQAVGEPKEIAAGTGSVTFESLEAGTYSVTIGYKETGTGIAPMVITDLVVTGETKPIVISQVTAGENKLTVTGTAEPGMDITLTTEPATTSTIVHVDESGNYTATLVVPAGTYTAVYAQYAGDTDSRVSATGSYVVTAPATKPPLRVDPIFVYDWTVLAQTTPGVVVRLKTYDHYTTVTADSRGILRFSMPHEYPKGTPITFIVFYGENNVQTYEQIEYVVDEVKYPLLKRGSYDYDVYRLTCRLVELGYLKEATYKYDDNVVAAVRLFQSMNGLAVDGMAGQLTQTALYSVSAIACGEKGVYPTLVRGNRGLALIYTLQQRLKDLGYYTIRVDGIFGSGTERAVRDFQRINGLSVTGRADNATQQLLYSSAAKPAGYYGGSYDSLARSSYYQAAVVPLQRRLRELGYYTGNIDGYFGSQTYRAVRDFQSRNGITVTGVADSYTQQVLYSASAKAASGSSSDSTGYRLLYWGCKGDAVRRLQQALLDKGYTQVRVVDGIYGQWTYDAVRAYQKDHGLAVDGIAGKNTQNSLYGTSY